MTVEELHKLLANIIENGGGGKFIAVTSGEGQRCFASYILDGYMAKYDDEGYAEWYFGEHKEVFSDSLKVVPAIYLGYGWSVPRGVDSND